MFGRALFPTDLSAYASAVLKCLPDLKAAGLREVVLLNVISSGDVPLGGGADRDLLENLKWVNQQKLDVARLALEGQGLCARTRVEVGIPVLEIIRVAQEERVQLIVMGAQGKSLVQEFLLGSVTNEVVRRASVPVLIEKFDVIREMEYIECKRVCAGLSF